MSRRKLWVGAFLTLTAASVGMELVAAFAPSKDRPAWTDLIVQYLPESLTLGLVGILTAWLGPHFIAAYRRKRAGQPPKGNQ